MELLCLSQELDFLRQANSIFAGPVTGIGCCGDPKQFLDSAARGSWNAFLIDLDALTPEHGTPVEFVGALGSGARVLVLGSCRSVGCHKELLALGALVLHKPTTVGEMGLALRRLALASSDRSGRHQRTHKPV